MTAIFGHRGARGERPENTIAAFQYARSLGLAGIECDIALTREFVPVVHHNPDLLQGNLIRDLSLEELHQLAPHVPTLVQALDAAPDMEWLIEIKTFPHAPGKSYAPEIMAEAVLGVLKSACKLSQACILAFDWRVLSAARRSAPECRLICLTEPQTERSRNVWWDQEITERATPDAVSQANAFGWAPFHATLSLEQIVRAHALGLHVFPWTVNEADEFRRLAPMVDGIITDFPSRFLSK